MKKMRKRKKRIKMRKKKKKIRVKPDAQMLQT